MPEIGGLMNEIFDFMNHHRIFSCILIFLNMILLNQLLFKISIHLNSHIHEASGGRDILNSWYKRCKALLKKSIEKYEGKEEKFNLYAKARDRMKKCGYRSEYAPVIYITTKYLLPILLFMLSFVINFPHFTSGLFPAVMSFISVELVLRNRKRKLNLQFQKDIYKIYKYLHNQVSSGVKVTDAIKTVYQTIGDKSIQDLLIILAARYELSHDINASLDDFKSNFDVREVETLCIALKQGITTGDNQELLARQEQIMFNQYFNFIQAETDSLKFKSLMVVSLFTAIVVIMIVIPLFNDVTGALGKIFIN